jgi:hypothetical protein
MRDLVGELERLVDVADRLGETELIAAADGVRALAERLRAQFVTDLTGPLAPSEAPVRLDEVRERRTAVASPMPTSATRIPAAR